MKAAIIIFVFGIVALESTYSQCLSSYIGAPVGSAIVSSNSVATSLADTLSLLTVSSLLAEKLPLGYPYVGPVGPCGQAVAAIAPTVATVAPYSGCGCGCGGCGGCGGYGYPYNSYIL